MNFRFAALAAAFLALACAVQAAPAPSDSATSASAKAAYPLSTCVVSDEKLGEHGTPVTKMVEGREVKLCCKACVDELEANPKQYIEKLDKAIIAAQLPTYPLKSCIVTDEPLGKKTKNIVVQNQLFRVCCNSCVDELKADPAKYAAKLQKAARP